MKKLIFLILVVIYQPSFAQFYREASGIDIGKVKCFLPLQGSGVLVGSENGLFSYQQNAVLPILPASIHGVNDMTYDNSGNLWLATSNLGLVKMNGSATSIVQAWSNTNSVLPYELDFVEFDPVYGLWIGNHFSLWNMNGSQILHFPFPTGSQVHGVREVLTQSSGQTVFLLHDSVCVYNSVHMEPIAYGYYDFLSEAAPGELLVGNDTIILRYDGTAFIMDSLLTQACTPNNTMQYVHLSANKVIKMGSEYYVYNDKIIITCSLTGEYSCYFPSIDFVIPNMTLSSMFSQAPKLFLGFSDGFFATDNHFVSILKNSNQWIDLYRMRAPVFASGTLFNFVEILNGPVFEAPAGSGKSPMYIAMPWIAGLDQNNELHVAVHRYNQVGIDFFTGTLKMSSAEPSGNVNHCRVWKLNQSEIDYHKTHWNVNGYVAPEAIVSWPGNGNPQFDEAPVLAPFADINQNGFYEPALGEYPIIRGEQAIYFIFNDAADVHTESGGEILGLEIHGMAYVMRDSSTQTGINNTDNTLFMHYTIMNRSSNDYHKLRIGIFSDIDIGNAYNDYAGCDTLQDAFFVYNRAGVDSSGVNCQHCYTDVLPAMGVTFLSHKMRSFYVFNNFGISPQYYSDPTMYQHYWCVLNGWFNDGSPITYGGNGYGGTVPVLYTFPGAPEDPMQWSDMSAGNQPYDRRAIGTIEFDSLGSGQSVCLDFAFVYDDEISGTDNTANVIMLRKRIGEVRSFFYNQQFECLYYEHNFTQPQAGTYVDTLLAFVDTCVIDPYLPVDTAWIEHSAIIGNMAYVDWGVKQNGNTFFFYNVPYYIQNSGNQLFILVLRCYADGRGSQMHLTYLNGASNVAPEAAKPVLELAVFPNPATEYITVVIPEMHLPELIRIIDLNGQVVDSFEATTSSVSIPLHYLAPGTYMIHASKSDVTKPFLIMRN